MSIPAPAELTTTTSQNELLRGPGQLPQGLQPSRRSATRATNRVDTARLTQGARLVAQATGWAQGQNNAAQAQALTDVADAGLKSIGDALQQMRALAMQAANGLTLSAKSRDALDTQYAQLADQVQAIAQTTRYNDTQLTDGTTPMLRFQVGANAGEANGVTAKLPDATAQSLGIDKTDLHDQQDAQDAISSLDAALRQISQDRENLSATSQTLQSAQHFAQMQNQTIAAAQERRSAASPSGPALSEEAQAAVRSRSTRRAQLLYESLLPKYDAR